MNAVRWRRPMGPPAPSARRYTMTTMKRNLAKGLLPALFLSAVLSVPAASVAAPSPHGKAHAADKANKNKQQKVKQVKQQRVKQVKVQRQPIKARQIVV